MNIENQILERYSKGKSIRTISKELGLGYYKIRSTLIDKKVLRKKNKYSKRAMEIYSCHIRYLSEDKNMGFVKISELLHIKRHWIKKICDMFKIKYKHRVSNYSKITKERELEAIKLYMLGESITKISKKFYCANTQIADCLRKNNVKLRPPNKYEFKRDIFDNGINTKELAWLWGMLMTDGCAHKGNIIFYSTDLDVVEKCKNIFRYTGKITQSLGYRAKKILYKFTITNKNLYEKCVNFGFIPQKSLKMQFPDSNILSENLYSHYLRGVFDGNGSLSNTVSLIGHIDFVLMVKKIISDNLNFVDEDIKTRFCVHNNPKLAVIYICKKKNGKKLFDWLYSDSKREIRMDRKYNTYLRKYYGVSI